MALIFAQSAATDVTCVIQNTGSIAPACIINDSINVYYWEKLNFILPPGVAPKKIERIEFNDTTAWRSQRFPVQIFETFLHLRKLKLRVEIDKKTLRQEDFVDATRLTELILIDGHLETIPSRVFHTVLGLKLLVLRNNKIQTLEDYAFDNLEQLEVLSLSENDIKAINRSTFGALCSLRALYLRQNRIESIEDGAFDMPNLKQLSLSGNLLSTLSDDIFKKTPALSVLLVEGNNIQEVHSSLYGLQELRKLVLSYNQITDLNLVELAKLPKLEYLLLRKTDVNLDWVNVTDADLNSTVSILKVLDLGENGIRYRDVFRKLKLFKQLEVVSFVSNDLTLLDLELKEPALKVIDLGNNYNFNWNQIVPAVQALNMRIEAPYIVVPGNHFDFENFAARLREDSVHYL